jgi:hypothetical protein
MVWLLASLRNAKKRNQAMKRSMRLLLGSLVVTTLYLLPEATLAEAKRVLEAVVVIQLFFEALKP